MSESDLLRMVLAVAVLVFSCVIHECAHVWTAWKFGDPTGRSMGRLTLNPLPHVDLFWTILLPIFTYFRLGYPIGGPKPAPVNPHMMRDPRLGGVSSALAGPASNMLLALAGLGTLLLLRQIVPDLVPPNSVNALFFFYVWFINGILAVLNLIPVPPLDGSRILHWVVGRPMDRLMETVERSGWLTAIPIYLAFIFLGPYATQPFRVGTWYLLAALFGDEYAEALRATFTGS